MAYVGVGATEFRILMVVWAIAGVTFGLHEPLVHGISTIDLVILILALFAVLGLGIKATLDARDVALEEGTTPLRQDEAIEPTEAAVEVKV